MEQYNSSSLQLWKKDLYRINDSDLVKSIGYLTKTTNHYIMVTHDRCTTYMLCHIRYRSLTPDGRPKYVQEQPIKVDELNGKHIQQIDHGYDFIMILVDDGIVYQFGDEYSEWTPLKQFKCISNVDRFKTIKCGRDHCLFLRNDGKLFAMGTNRSGQITGSEESYKRMIDTGLENVSDCFCGGNHSFAVTKDGNIFAWGDNESGQLGLGDTRNRHQPTLVKFPDSIQNVWLKDIGCGQDHTLFLFENGHLYGCGSNKDGELGLKRIKHESQIHTFPTLIPIPTPVSVIACLNSERFSLAANNDNHYYAWGELDRERIFRPRKLNKSIQSFADVTALYFKDYPFTFGMTKIL
ncbi:RCC1 and BTB domain-containing protein 2 [Dermatophagoides pteronyssinus]|uniref:RCC1 and BTB domain-containing protein 2 n=1 Tax=Dermatophagoides pteronyssinus TaxID=6956 RepID=A0ABQ8ITC1_DERPT|nr:RCC1 and BTB domain-containing protein 2 [Dermatophagoides pteronyssinus]